MVEWLFRALDNKRAFGVELDKGPDGEYFKCEYYAFFYLPLRFYF